MQLILQLGPTIATITTREQLYSLLTGPLMEQIGFQHTAIFVPKNNGPEMSNFLSDYDHSTDPGIDVDSETHRFPLVQGGSAIGIWMVLFKKGATPGGEQLSICRMLSIQLTFAIIAIKTQEEIDARNKEREIIHSLNIDFATLREKKDLLRIIHYKLKNLFDFSHHWVATVNEDELTMSTFMQDSESRTKFHPKYRHVTYARYPIADQVFNKVILAGEPQVFDLDRLIAQKVIPEYLQINYESGIRKVIMQSLEIAGRFIGVWAICLTEQHIVKDTCINLIRDLASQFSIAIGNILANERIVKRETERDLLLSLSIDIAAVRTNEKLHDVITQRLKHLLKFSHTVLATINEDATVSGFLLDPEAPSKSHPQYQQALQMRHPIGDNILDRSMLTPEPLLFNLQQLVDLSGGDIPLYVKVNYESGTKDMVVVRFSKGDHAFGFWLLFFDHAVVFDADTQSLIKGLSHQLSIAVSNLMANEKINNQLAEINTYKHQLEEEKIYLKAEIETAQNYSDIIGESPSIKKIFKLVSQVAPSDSTVLILGETGTGKELIARAIHNDSSRKDKLMVKVNCAALPPNLIESELFGHERGSFTGATEQRLGKFELANNSTLFLDEIGEMPLDLQVKLLRVLQEKEIERVGGRKTIKVDVRIVAATNRDLEKEVAGGRFRSDLYYRLNIFPIWLPPLRDRRADIPLLAAYFIQRFAKKAGRQITTFSNRALQEMMQYSWPGNIRELEHLIERSVLLSSGDTIRHIHLPSGRPVTPTTGAEEWILKTIDDNERDHILRTLQFCGGKLSGENGAAQLLGVPPGTLYSKMKRLGIKREYSS